MIDLSQKGVIRVHAGAPNVMRLLPIVSLCMLGACMEVPVLPTITPHRMEIQQGNFVTQEMVAKLQPGMTRSQVRFILGTPLVVDPFRSDRWDYFYVLQKRGTTVEQRRIIVVFKDDKLDRIEGDVVPAARGAAPGGATASGAVPRTPQGAPAPARPAADTAGSSLTTSASEPVAGAPPAPEPAEAQKPKPEPEPQKAERGFFGRMLERMGF